MVSPNRHGHIVAPRPETRVYGKYRNITPRCALHQPLQRINTPREGGGLSCGEREQSSTARSCEHPEGRLAPPTVNNVKRRVNVGTQQVR
ncbi:hypothetical protein L226DRAFT_529271 [Lentinus tigrinus ALCF2SS1-7]|uniref:Uncharacterized protein n=1 Tax=Lentinus tigrinus ALCF2SS1-6 TaxID=1328759 RepID=A0A5C2STA3_9APHY|nr:hypothetical protein L227DRAFT_569082 [Lentinus tigrinus ALCF2SS1-6]RPD80816.1 hypothetical protein L226DRAFT_529271 [Lentinus tigrinus ALCF2SS1-7]